MVEFNTSHGQRFLGFHFLFLFFNIHECLGQLVPTSNSKKFGNYRSNLVLLDWSQFTVYEGDPFFEVGFLHTIFFVCMHLHYCQ